MFKDALTGKQSLPKQKPMRIITKTRHKQYCDKEGKVISVGWEIVEEKLVLPETAEQFYNGEKNDAQENPTFGRSDKSFKVGTQTIKKRAFGQRGN